MVAQVRAHLRLDLGRVLAGVDRRALVVGADRVGEAATAVERHAVGRDVVHAEEALHAGRLRLLARRVTRDVLGLADMHDRAQLRALFFGAGVDRHERDLLRGDFPQRILQHVVIGDRRDHAVVVARGRLLDQARHVGDVAVRRIAVIGRDIEILVRLLDRVLDRVPPRIGIGRVAHEREARARRLGCRGRAAHARRDGDRGDACAQDGLASAKSHVSTFLCLSFSGERGSGRVHEQG
ncbi:Uncharacterised protein [Burkholderia pseudomallei]|nr:Uncharacterised protein [Burkholderia pseudomallei]